MADNVQLFNLYRGKELLVVMMLVNRDFSR